MILLQYLRNRSRSHILKHLQRLLPLPISFQSVDPRSIRHPVGATSYPLHLPEHLFRLLPFARIATRPQQCRERELVRYHFVHRKRVDERSRLAQLSRTSVCANHRVEANGVGTAETQKQTSRIPMFPLLGGIMCRILPKTWSFAFLIASTSKPTHIIELLFLFL